MLTKTTPNENSYGSESANYDIMSEKSMTIP